MMRSRRRQKPATMTVGLSLSCKPLTKRLMPEHVKDKAAKLYQKIFFELLFSFFIQIPIYLSKVTDFARHLSESSIADAISTSRKIFVPLPPEV